MRLSWQRRSHELNRTKGKMSAGTWGVSTDRGRPASGRNQTPCLAIKRRPGVDLGGIPTTIWLQQDLAPGAGRLARRRGETEAMRDHPGGRAASEDVLNSQGSIPAVKPKGPPSRHPPALRPPRAPRGDRLGLRPRRLRPGGGRRRARAGPRDGPPGLRLRRRGGRALRLPRPRAAEGGDGVRGRADGPAGRRGRVPAGLLPGPVGCAAADPGRQARRPGGQRLRADAEPRRALPGDPPLLHLPAPGDGPAGGPGPFVRRPDAAPARRRALEGRGPGRVRRPRTTRSSTAGRTSRSSPSTGRPTP